MKDFTEHNLDVLQNLEAAIVQVYRADNSLLDFDVKDAMDALVRHYHAEEEQRRPPVARLGERAQRVFSAVQPVCEWRLGRNPAAVDEETDDEETFETDMQIDVLVKCLRQIQKSVPFWSQRGGRQGYLKFVSEHMP